MSDTFNNPHQAVRALEGNVENLATVLLRTQMLREYVLAQGYYTETTLPTILKEARDAEYEQAITLADNLHTLWQAKIDEAGLV